MPSVCPVEEEFNNFPFVKWRFFEKHSKMDLNNHRSEIEQFLSDLRDHLRYSIEPAEYENTVSLFGDSSEYQNRKFLDRCEKILGYFTDTSNNNHKLMQNGVPTPDKAAPSIRNSKIEHNETEEISYLEMSSTPPKKGLSTEYIDFQDQNAAIKSPLRQSHPAENGDNDEEDDDDADEENKILDKGIYDICNESPQSDDGLKSHQDSENVNALDCPYAGLPACHLSIQKSNKYGQLQRIEKRLFFDQSKKCYCGILSDWLLCYCDGVTSLRPSFSVHLKAHGVEVEHHGEGKRREICFQITTSDPNKKHVFQCNTEVEAKEWIHAIEAAIRGDCTPQAITAKSPRKLPTPPTVKKTYIDDRSINNNDCIYEEPSPLYNMHQPTELLIARNEEDQNKAPEIPEKQNSKTNIAKKFDYDIPKSPPPPVNAESETAELLDLSRNNSDFQNKVKDVHSKLSSQLSTTGPNSDRLKKIAKKTVSSDSETSALSPQQILPTPTKEQKKAIKTAQKLSKTPNQEKTSRNWFLNRLNKSTSSTRSSTTSPTKCKQSEKENLLNNLEICDGYEGEFLTPSNGTTPIKGGSKVNMIINQFEASGHLAMFNVETYNGGNSDAKLSSFCDSDCNNYEPIMTGPSSFMKKV